MERIGDWSSGADDARVENTKTVMLGVETNDNFDDEKSGRVETSETGQRDLVHEKLLEHCGICPENSQEAHL